MSRQLPLKARLKPRSHGGISSQAKEPFVLTHLHSKLIRIFTNSDMNRGLKVYAPVRTLRTVVSTQQTLVHVLTALGDGAKVPAGAAQGRAVVASRRVGALFVIATAWTDQALVNVHAVARPGVPLVPQLARLRGPVVICILKRDRYDKSQRPRALLGEIAYRVAAGRRYPVVAQGRKASIRRGSSGGARSGGQRLARVGAIGIEATVGRGVASVQTQQALVYVLAEFVRPVGRGGTAARLEAGRTSWRTPIAAVSVEATLAGPAGCQSVRALVDVCGRRIS